MTIGGSPVEEYASENNLELDKQEIADKTKNGGAEVISLKGATFYGIAMTVSRIVEAVEEDENAVLPVAHVLGDEFGQWSDVAISMPCVLNRKGIVRTINIPMDDEEKAAMDHSAQILKDFLEKALAE